MKTKKPMAVYVTPKRRSYDAQSLKVIDVGIFKFEDEKLFQSRLREQAEVKNGLSDRPF